MGFGVGPVDKKVSFHACRSMLAIRVCTDADPLTLQNAEMCGFAAAGQIQPECTTQFLQQLQVEATGRLQEQVQARLNLSPLDILSRTTVMVEKYSARMSCVKNMVHYANFAQLNIDY